MEYNDWIIRVMNTFNYIIKFIIFCNLWNFSTCMFKNNEVIKMFASTTDRKII